MFKHILAMLLVCLATTSFAQRRVALVIGNADYEHATHLANPLNDAQAISEELTGLGFEVFLYENLTGNAFRVALGGFAEEALHADLAVVFYAGHGIEMSGRNYLVPTDAQMVSEATAQYEAVSLDDVLSSVRNAGKLGLVMMDACRDNPFSKTMTRKNGTRAVSRGLAPVTLDGEAGILVSFAAQAGDVADDGNGMHSPYTEALLQLMDEPGLEIGAMFQKVTKVVKDKTDGRQKPMYRIQPPEDLVYLVPQSTTGTPTPVPAPMPAATQSETPKEDPLVIYLDAVRSQKREPLEAFIARYPDHPQTPAAKELLLDIADREFWESTAAQNSVSGYDTYLKAFPNGRYRVQAQASKDALAEPAKPKAQTAKKPAAPAPSAMAGIRTSCPAFNGSYAVQNIRTDDTLYVRAGPGTEHAVVGELPYNANGVQVGSCTKNGWCTVTYGCISGYSFGKYLGQQVGMQPASKYADYYDVVNHPLDEVLNVRAGPGTTYSIVATLPPNATQIFVEDCQVKKGFSNPWCAITWQGISGWAYGKYLAN